MREGGLSAPEMGGSVVVGVVKLSELDGLDVQPPLNELDVAVAAEQALVVEFPDGAHEADKNKASGLGLFRESTLQNALRFVQFDKDPLVALLLFFMSAELGWGQGFSQAHLEGLVAG